MNAESNDPANPMIEDAQSWLPFPVNAFGSGPRVRAPLTSVQKQVFDFIVDYRRDHGVSPTLQEIGDKLKTHRVTVHAHVKELLEKKYLVRFSNRASRSLIPLDELEKSNAAANSGAATGTTHSEPRADAPVDTGSESSPSPLLLPLSGRIAAGQPIEAVYDNEVIDIAALFPRERDLYVLEVTGDSMIEDQIRSGDYVVVERRSTARNGEIVVAVLPSSTGGSGEATLKRFFREGNRIRLQPSNPQMVPIYVEAPTQLEIRGVVVGVVRRYH